MRAERLFRSPQLFCRNRPKIPCTWPNNPTRPASFLRQFSPQHSPVVRLFRGKKGLFCPQRPPYPPPKGTRTPRFAPAPPGFCPARARMETRLAPVFPGTPAPAHTPGTPEAPACAAFLPTRTRFRPPCAARTPVAAARRPKVSPPPRRGTALGLATPTAEVGFPASP